MYFFNINSSPFITRLVLTVIYITSGIVGNQNTLTTFSNNTYITTLSTSTESVGTSPLGTSTGEVKQPPTSFNEQSIATSSETQVPTAEPKLEIFNAVTNTPPGQLQDEKSSFPTTAALQFKTMIAEFPPQPVATISLTPPKSKSTTNKPLFEIRTMIDELPPDLLPDESNSENTFSTTTPTLEIRTMVEELPWFLQNPPLSDDVDPPMYETETTFEELAPELILTANTESPLINLEGTTLELQYQTFSLIEELPPHILQGIPPPEGTVWENPGNPTVISLQEETVLENPQNPMGIPEGTAWENSHNQVGITPPEGTAWENSHNQVGITPPEGTAWENPENPEWTDVGEIISIESVPGPPHPPNEGILFIRIMNVFDEIGIQLPGLSFEEQVIAIEREVGSTVCGLDVFPSSHSYARGRKGIDNCYCDQACVVLHNCCPDLLIRNITSHDEGQGSECVMTVPTGVNMSAIKEDDFTTMVTSCPESNKRLGTDSPPQTISSDIVKKCEDPDSTDPKQNLPVSSKGEKITYRNIFCAQCNWVNISDTNNVHKWYATVKCPHGMRKLLSGNPDKLEIFRRLNTKEEVARTGCELRYEIESFSGYGRPCKPIETPMIERCNQTGNWDIYDARLDRACSLYTSVVFKKYKNVFCYLCNLKHQPSMESLEKDIIQFSGDAAHAARVSFNALLDFSDSYDTVEKEVLERRSTQCDGNQIYNNITCECQDLKCSEGKQLSPKENASTCSSAISSNYIGYSICLQIDLVFKDNISDISPIIDNVSDRFCCFDAIALKITSKYWCPGDKNVTLNAEILDYYQFGSRAMTAYDESSVAILSNSLTNSKYWLPLGLESHVITVRADCPSDHRASTPCVHDRNLTVAGRRKEGNLIMNIDYLEWQIHFIPFRMTNLCPHVDLPGNDFETLNGSVYHTATNIKLDPDLVDLVDNNTLRVCEEAFLNVLSSVDTARCVEHSPVSDEEDVNKWTVEGLVSIVCTSLSLFCLFLTFVTYLIFKSLRDASGKNIMMLTVLLFLAQAFFEFALEQFENEAACKFFGISIHYFWLAAVFSMNACTIERFYKLCFPLRSRAFFYSDKPFLTASGYSLISPLIIVGINILINQQVKGHIGYGNSQICYIRELYSRIFAFAVPLAILLLMNLVLFAITIYNIRRQTVPGHKSASTRIGIKACVQLSFVTGLTWLLAFLYEFISVSDIFGYVFTALIGLQGVLFFYSIVLNKRVIALYKALFRPKYKGSGSGGNYKGSSGSSSNNDGHKKCILSKQTEVYKISFSNKTFHSDLTKTSSGDSGVAL